MAKQLANQVREAFQHGRRFHLPALSAHDFAGVMRELRK